MFEEIKISIQKICRKKSLFKECYFLIKDYINEYDYYETIIKHENILNFCSDENKKEIICCNSDHTISIYNHNMEVLDVLKLNSYELQYVEKMKSKNNILLLGFLGGLILIIDKKKKKILNHNRYHYDAIMNLEFIDENYFLSTSMDYTIKIFDILGNCYRCFTGHECYVFDANIRNNEIISCDANKKVKVWNIENEKCLLSLEIHKESIISILIIENKIITASWDKSIKIHDNHFNLKKEIIEKCEILNLKKFYNRFFISHNIDNDIKIWNLEGKCLKVFNHRKFKNYKMDVLDKKILFNDINRKEFIIYSF